MKIKKLRQKKTHTNTKPPLPIIFANIGYFKGLLSYKSNQQVISKQILANNVALL
jgi:hypothetical protein